MWGFYFVTDDLAFNTDKGEVTDSHKWTDDFVIRVFKEKTPESVIKLLEGKLGRSSDKNVDFAGADHHYAEWHFDKKDLEKILDGISAA